MFGERTFAQLGKGLTESGAQSARGEINDTTLGPTRAIRCTCLHRPTTPKITSTDQQHPKSLSQIHNTQNHFHRPTTPKITSTDPQHPKSLPQTNNTQNHFHRPTTPKITFTDKQHPNSLPQTHSTQIYFHRPTTPKSLP